MFQFSSITGLQFILIGIGLLFQVLAVSATRREPSIYRGHESVTEDETPKVQPSRSNPTQEKIVLPQPQQKTRQRDYYEMEETPPGVPPAELRRTARVTYIRN